MLRYGRYLFQKSKSLSQLINLGSKSSHRAFASLSDDSNTHGSAAAFGLTEDQMEFERIASDFARNELTPFAAEWDREKHFPIETLRKAAQLGFAGLYCKEDVGGAGLGRADGAVIFEALAYGDISTTSYLTIHNMVSSVIDRYGTEEHRQKYLPSLTCLDSLSSYCLTEPGSGSDAAALQTTAVRKDGGYVLNGTKAFISGGGVSDIYLVMARTGAAGPKGISAFLVEKGTPGLSFGKAEEKLGWNSQPTASVILDKVALSADAMLGQEGGGFKIAMSALDGGRINIATCSVGGAQFCLDTAREYVQHRVQFGSKIGAFQATQFKIADMATSVQSSRLMVRHAAQALDAKAPTACLAAAMAKRQATDDCFDVANQALQLLGGYGYLRDFPIERVMRDLRVHSILEGTNEIMRVIISRELEKLYGTV